MAVHEDPQSESPNVRPSTLRGPQGRPEPCRGATSSGRREPAERRTSEGLTARTLTEDTLDAVLASLTDAVPSPALQANVMRRVAEASRSRTWNPASAGFGWRAALAAAALVVIAASIWLALGHTPAPQVAVTRRPSLQDAAANRAHDRQSSPDATLPPSPSDQARDVAALGERTSRGIQGSMHAPTAARGTAAAATRGRQPANYPGSQLTNGATNDVAIPPLAPPDPLNPPDPLHVAPLIVDSITLERLEIPPLQIDPVEGKPSKERGR